jgi:hypothetical protein
LLHRCDPLGLDHLTEIAVYRLDSMKHGVEGGETMTYKMSVKTPSALLLLLMFLLPSLMANAEIITRQDKAKLMGQCMKAREKLLAPERAEAVQWCIEKRSRGKAYCQRYHSGYGDRRYRPNGTWETALYMDLPICQKAVMVDKYFFRNPRTRSFVSR